MHNVEISGFFCHSDTWNQIWSFWSHKYCNFDHFEFWIFENFWHCQVWNFSKNQNSKPPKLLKRLLLTFWNQPKLFLREIRVPGKLPNFHTVEFPSIVKIPNYAAQVCRNSWFVSLIFLSFFNSQDRTQLWWCHCRSHWYDKVVLRHLGRCRQYCLQDGNHRCSRKDSSSWKVYARLKWMVHFWASRLYIY